MDRRLDQLLDDARKQRNQLRNQGFGFGCGPYGVTSGQFVNQIGEPKYYYKVYIILV